MVGLFVVSCLARIRVRWLCLATGLLSPALARAAEVGPGVHIMTTQDPAPAYREIGDWQTAGDDGLVVGFESQLSVVSDPVIYSDDVVGAAVEVQSQLHGDVKPLGIRRIQEAFTIGSFHQDTGPEPRIDHELAIFVNKGKMLAWLSFDGVNETPRPQKVTAEVLQELSQRAGRKRRRGAAGDVPPEVRALGFAMASLQEVGARRFWRRLVREPDAMEDVRPDGTVSRQTTLSLVRTYDAHGHLKDIAGSLDRLDICRKGEVKAAKNPRTMFLLQLQRSNGESRVVARAKPFGESLRTIAHVEGVPTRR